MPWMKALSASTVIFTAPVPLARTNTGAAVPKVIAEPPAVAATLKVLVAVETTK